ncbi:hypothetical protein I316_04331 [Kwoniella heveanensis BCC8398]|uniref:Uncharacterized protein n=1 Tax=Kwoniella heveanensis BCC8398 TaxID=1296120 RepID=A0A1B9GSZ9_9TREE|nr:hypothetical protein I316_04331 [Kwoniella heveanensis BCC8398]
MPVIPFLKSDKEKEKERERDQDRPIFKDNNITSNDSGSTVFPAGSSSSIAPPTPSSAGPIPSPQPPSNHSFSSPSATSVNTDSPNSTPSKYHPSRLLRRKASVSAKNANSEKEKEKEKEREKERESDVDPLPTGSSTSTTFNSDSGGPISPRALPSSPRRLPSSPRGLPSSPRTFFGFEGSDNRDRDKDKEKFHTFPRRGSDVRRGSLGASITNGLPSPTASKRSAYVYNGRLTTEGAADEAVVIISSARAEDDQELSSDLAALGLRSASALSTSESPLATLSSSVPKVLDGGFGLEHASGLVFGSGPGYSFSRQVHRYDHSGAEEGLLGKIAKDQDALIDTRFTHNRPLTPPDSASYLHATHPFYPTALSPPRRPMPKSPRATANLRQRESSSSGPSNTSYTPPSVGMMQATSAVGGSSSCVSPRQPSWESCTQPHSIERPTHPQRNNTSSPTPEPRRSGSRPTVTAEWLARKPSTASPTPKRLRPKHRASLSVDDHQLHQHSQSSLRSSPSQPIAESEHLRQSPHSSIYPSTPKRQGSLDASPDIGGAHLSTMSSFASSSSSSHPVARPKPRSTSFSSTNSDTDLDPPSSDGEIGVNSRRRSLLATPSHSRSAKVPSPSGAVPHCGGYEVEILCKDNRVGQPHGVSDNDTCNGEGAASADREDAGVDEIRWEVVIRRQTSRSTSQTPTSPLQLSTTSSIATAPISASSINLSLSLDQPTGKLVFISFPMDIHATPTRRRRPSMNAVHGRSGSSNGSILQQIASPRSSSATATTNISSPSSVRPSTPPLQTRSSLSNVSLNDRDTPTRTPSSRRKAPPAWPSPKAKVDPSTLSPSVAAAGQPDQSPRDVFTPRKSRVTPSRLDGDLLNKVTNAD